MCVVGDGGEKKGYERLTPEEYTNGIRKDEFLFFYSEKKEYFGLRKQEILNIQKKKKKVPIFASNFENAKKIKKSKFEANFIGVLPPSLEELTARIVGRGSETPEQIRLRQAQVRREFEQAAPYEYFVVNDDLDEAVEKIKSIIVAEGLKPDYDDVISKYFGRK